MLNFNFREFILLFVIGLIILGPQRSPIAIKNTINLVKIFNKLLLSIKYGIVSMFELENLQNKIKIKDVIDLQEHFTKKFKYLMIEYHKKDINKNNIDIKSTKFNNINNFILLYQNINQASNYFSKIINNVNTLFNFKNDKL
ncbi:hypothetical protein CRV12_03605 [Candidatus Pantoea edessiphila]|uniref:Sec-independent protein translocase protein TatB n=1 Tax=Candidatus Pantoea edessiphila TaxID=2044610 RepID=A0A2P5SZB3_9GAMM|nr:hypothetical protein CRV12_03605 [Candidatus Pantoea edessiphila]